MRKSDSAIEAALDAALTKRGLSGASANLLPIEPPRDWGVTSSVCFTLAGRVAAAEVATATTGMDKKEAKARAGEITRAAGPKLAAELAAELHSAFSSRDVKSPDSPSRSGDVQSLDLSAAGPAVSRVEAEGAYLNFYFHPAAMSAAVVGDVVVQGQRYGAGRVTGKRIMVEYAQPNTHKDFHVGHLRNAAIGQAIANLLEFDGNEVKKATYIGDVGAHVAKAMWGHNHRNDPKYFPAGFKALESLAHGDQLAYWGACYQAGNGLVEAPDAVEELRNWLRRWEEGEHSARSDWQLSRDGCVEAFRQIFSELRVEFDPDCWFFESTVDDSHLGQQTAAELKQRGIAVVDDTPEYKGALYVDFAAHADSPVFRDGERKRIRQLGKMTILRSDGTSLYQTKELGLAKYKFDNFAIDESLYVVGSEQKLYFEQVFAILRLWGFPNAENCRHIAYELVVLPEGKMSSREGTVVSYRDLRDEAVRRAEAITAEKGIAGDVKQVSHNIAIASVKYAMLQVSGNQQITFDFEQALSFEGRSAPYLQYAYARAGKLIPGYIPPAAGFAPAGVQPSEVELARQLAEFPEIVSAAAHKYEPAIVCNYLYVLASAFSDFYRDCRVLDAPAEVKPWRQALTYSFRTVLASGFRLLALPLPEEM